MTKRFTHKSADDICPQCGNEFGYRQQVQVQTPENELDVTSPTQVVHKTCAKKFCEWTGYELQNN